MVREGLKPLNMSAGDFDLAVAPDGKAYYYFERVHSETICADLTADYTDVTGYYSTHFPHTAPPYVREATAHFYRKGKHYLVTSGTTGYLPNPSEVAVADTWHGPFRVLGDPHPDDISRTSYHSQISSVFKVEGRKDLYIAVADRWVSGHMDWKYENYKKVFERMFNPDAEAAEESGSERQEDAQDYELDSRIDTSVADYVWLPFRFEGEMAYLDWMDSWRIEDYR